MDKLGFFSAMSNSKTEGRKLVFSRALAPAGTRMGKQKKRNKGKCLKFL
jgi:hypothetical protein